MENWIDEVVHVHREFESPLNFWRWAAMAAISAVVKDNVYLNQGMFKLYPNIYVLLHADSGLKKGPAVSFARTVVDYVGNTRVIRGRSSIQGILAELTKAETRPGKELLKTACAFLCWSEFSAAIVADPAAMTILTDLYDRNYNFENYTSLLKSEKFDIKDPTITMLAATNQAHSNTFFENKDIAGGFFARTFIIYEKEENRINSLQVPPEAELDYPKLAEYLKELAKLKGPFKSTASRIYTPDYPIAIHNEYDNRDYYYTATGALYEEWYKKFKAEVKGVEDPTGTLNRFGTSVYKVAMLYALAESPVLEISEKAMQHAITTCEKLVGNIRKVTTSRVGDVQTTASLKVLLIEELYKRETHSISRQQLHQKYWLQGSFNEWDEVCAACKEAGLIVIEPIGNSVVYRMPPEMVDKLKSYYEGRNIKP